MPSSLLLVTVFGIVLHVRTYLTTLRNSFCDFFTIFREIFANFRDVFDVFASISKFSDVLGPIRPIRTCWDAFGCIRIHSEAFGRLMFFSGFSFFFIFSIWPYSYTGKKQKVLVAESIMNGP